MIPTSPCRVLQALCFFSFHRKNLLVIGCCSWPAAASIIPEVFSLYDSFSLPSIAGSALSFKYCMKNGGFEIASSKLPFDACFRLGRINGQPQSNDFICCFHRRLYAHDSLLQYLYNQYRCSHCQFSFSYFLIQSALSACHPGFPCASF
jgi:hypothetical protein